MPRPAKRAWTFKTGGEVKSSPVVTDGKVLIGSYDSYLYALGVEGRESAVEGADRRLRPRHAGRRRRVAYCRLRRDPPRHPRVADGKEVLKLSSGAYTGASPLIVAGRAYYGTYDNEVLGRRSRDQEGCLALQAPRPRSFPFYSSAASPAARSSSAGATSWSTRSIARRARRRGRSRRARGSTRRRSSPAGVSTWDRRRQALRARRGDRQEPVRVRGGRPAVRVTGGGGRPAGHRIAGRQVVLPWGGATLGSRLGVRGARARSVRLQTLCRADDGSAVC